MTGKVFGKIDKVWFGYGGHQDAQFGLSVTLSGPDFGCGDFWGFWGTDIVPISPGYQWTEEDRDASFAKTMRQINDTLRAAKVRHVGELAGTPVEVEFERNILKQWRVLTEVL